MCCWAPRKTPLLPELHTALQDSLGDSGSSQNFRDSAQFIELRDTRSFRLDFILLAFLL